MCGYTTLRTALAATAASTAEPPARRTSRPAPDASACGHATMPRNASVAGRALVRNAPPARTRSPGLGEADRGADLGDLPRVVVPVIVEHRADEHRNRDLVGAHELLEQRNAGFPFEIALAELLEILEQLAPLGVERAGEILERHLLALRRHVGVAPLALDDRQLRVGKTLQERHGLPALLEQEVAQHLAGGPLARRVGSLRVGLHVRELTAQVRPRRLRLRLEIAHRCRRHGVLPSFTV